MISYLLRGLLLGLSAAATPGPFQAYLLSQTSRHGWRRTLPAALAPLFSDWPIVALVLFVLTRTPTWFLDGLKVVGGVFILYLAWQAWRAFRDYVPPAPDAAGGSRQSVAEATLMNLLNPNPYIFWTAVGGPILLEGWRSTPALGAAFLLGFYGTLVLGFAGFILLFGSAARFGPVVNRVLLAVAAVALALFGLFQVAGGFSAISG